MHTHNSWDSVLKGPRSILKCYCFRFSSITFYWIICGTYFIFYFETFFSPMNMISHSSARFISDSVQLLSRVRLFVTPWISALQASLSITISRSSLKLMSIESVMPSSHLLLCHPLLLLPTIPPSHQSLFQWVNSSHEVAKVLEFQL